MAKVKSPEEKLAIQLSKAVADLTLDIEQVGRYFATLVPSVSFNRLIVIAESAEYERERINDRSNFEYTLF
jgi:hypothetical protein